MSEFFVTFGQKYNREEHPALPGITADHYVVVEAVDEPTARAVTWEFMGEAWAFLHDADEFDPEFYPAGEFTRIYG